jgi:ribosomal protein S21
MSSNITVRLRRGESSERLVKRFIKKCKREKVLERYKDRTAHYTKPSVLRKLKSEKARREAKKLQRKRDEKLFR